MVVLVLYSNDKNIKICDNSGKEIIFQKIQNILYYHLTYDLLVNE